MLRTLLKPFSFVPAILIMYMIYTFSAQPDYVSSDLSYKVSYAIVKTADRILDANLEEWQIQDYAQRYHGVTRKIAHMGEYFLLAVAVSFPLYVYGMHGILLMVFAGMICVIYAGLDEYHQSFVSGRAASVIDVAIDGFGAFWGILFSRIIGWIGRHTIFLPSRRNRQSVSRRDLDRIRAQQREMKLAQKELRAEQKAARREQRMARNEQREMQRQMDLERMQQQREDRFYNNERERDGRSGRGRYDPRDRYDGYDDYDRYDDYDKYDRQYYDDRYEYDDEEYDYDEYDDYDEDEDDAEDSSDTLAEDMPLSGLFRHRRDKR